MSRLLEDRSAVGLQYCTFCQEQFPRDQLEWSAGRWACINCRAQSDSEQGIEKVSRLEEEEAPDHLAHIQRIDSGLGFAASFGRYGFYGLSCYLATTHEPINDMLHGVIMADFGTWILKSFFDFKDHRWPILIELFGFVILMSVMTHTDAIHVPSEPGAIGLAFLAFMLFFSVKGTLAMVRRIHSHASDS